MSRQVQAIDWEAGLTNAFDSVIGFVPKLVIFLVVLLIGWIIAKVVSKLVSTVLNKVGFNRVLERGGVTRYFSSSFGPIEMIAKIIYYWILLITLQLALQAFGPNPLTDIINDIFAWLPQLIVAIVIVVVVMAIANAVQEILSGMLSSVSYGSLLAKVASTAIIVFGVIAALNQIGIAITVTNSVLIAVLATIAGILIVGVGGGLVGPMRGRWETWLGQLEQESASSTDRSQQQDTGATQQSAYAEQGTYQSPAGGYQEPGGDAPRA